MTKKIYRAQPIISVVDIIFLVFLGLLLIGSLLGYIWDQFQRITAGRM
ncbi:MAG: hypothetical protein KAW51_09170 [Candidatus Lokiarchaeota archaeon]|nr:hypothetical protein [Candidatus Lokiarchaeota archaeon]